MPRSDLKRGSERRERERERDKRTYISVELPDEAREVVVLEVIGKEIASKLRRTPNNKGSIFFTPGDDVISGRVVHQLVCLGEKGSRHRFVGI